MLVLDPIDILALLALACLAALCAWHERRRVVLGLRAQLGAERAESARLRKIVASLRAAQFGWCGPGSEVARMTEAHIVGTNSKVRVLRVAPEQPAEDRADRLRPGSDPPGAA